MIEIQHKHVRFITRLLRVRAAAAKSDGGRSWSRYHLLAYNGNGQLTVKTTDNRIVLASTVPASGASAPWSAVTPCQSFDRTAAYAKRLTYPGMSGRASKRPVAIGPHGSRTLLVQKCNFRSGLPCYDPEAEFPLDIARDGAATWVTVSATPLADALSFLASGPGKEDSANNARVCSLFGDGLAASVHRGVEYMRSAPWTGLDIHLHLGDARRVLQWICAVRDALGEDSPELVLASLPDGRGGEHYCLRDAEGRHALYVPGAKRPLPRASIDRMRGESTIGMAELDREELSVIARLVSARSKHGRLVFRFMRHAGERWALDVREAGKGGEGIDETISVVPTGTARLETASHPREVGARRLADALGRFRGRRIQVAYRGDSGFLSITEADGCLVAHDDWQRCEAVLRTNPVREGDGPNA